MVDINPADWDAQRKAGLSGDDIPRYHREIIKTVRRLDIPLHNSGQLRKASEILRILANNLEAAYMKRDNPDLTETNLLYEAVGHIHEAKARLNELKPEAQKLGDNVTPLRP